VGVIGGILPPPCLDMLLCVDVKSGGPQLMSLLFLSKTTL